MSDVSKTSNNNTNVPATTTSKAGVKKSLSYDDKVIKKIAGIAASEVPGILTLSGGLMSNITDMFRSGDDTTKGIDAEVGEKQVALDLKVICEYGKNVPALFDAIIEKVSHSVKLMTGLDVVEVNMHVDDIISKEEFTSKQNAAEKKNAPKPASSSTSNTTSTDTDRVQ